MSLLYIIILNWNGRKDTLECLETLRNTEQERWSTKLIVVDNGSTDDSIEEIRKQYQDVKILRNEKNLGFSEGNNVGIKYALENGADYVMLLNNDTLAAKNLITELLKVTEQDKTIGIVGPKIYFAKGFEYHHGYKEAELGKVIWYAGGVIDWRNVYAFHRGVDEVDCGQYDEVVNTDFVSGCCFLVRREVFEKIGFFNPKYFIYFEDNDFCQRAKRSGFKTYYVPQAILWHKNAASSQKPGSKLHQYYQTRNRFLFGLKYAPIRSKLALSRESLRFLKEGGIKRIATLDFYLRKFGRKDEL